MLLRMKKLQTRGDAAAACTKIFDSDFLRALCEPVRVEILRHLILKGRSDVATVAEAMPQDRSVIARHLQVMARAGLLHVETEGRHTCYTIDGPSILSRVDQMAALLGALVPLCCPSLGAQHGSRRAPPA